MSDSKQEAQALVRFKLNLGFKALLFITCPNKSFYLIAARCGLEQTQKVSFERRQVINTLNSEDLSKEEIPCPKR